MKAEQIGMFDGSKRYKIRKPIRLIELFAGIGSQAKALQNIGADFEHYRICEFDKYAVQSYNASNAGVSNSQLYKQAGNSIVVKVLEAILKQMTAKVEEEVWK